MDVLVWLKKSVTRVIVLHHEFCSCIPFDFTYLVFKVEFAIKHFFSFKEFLLKFKQTDLNSYRRSVVYVHVEFA